MGRPKKLTLDFYLHDANASNDPKIIALRKRFGNDGWAAYFNLLEILCFQQRQKLDISEDWQQEAVASLLWLKNSAQLIEIVEYCVELGLFDKTAWLDNQTIAFIQRPLAAEWQLIRKQVFVRDNYTCQYCGVRGIKLQCDHVVPISRGGNNELNNLVAACVIPI